MYSDLFNQTHNFRGKYDIVLKTDSQPIIHAPQKCSIYMEDELKTELDGMVKHDNIHKVHEPTVLLCTCANAMTNCEYATSIQKT